MTLIRIAFLLLAIFGIALPVLIYIALYVVLPDEWDLDEQITIRSEKDLVHNAKKLIRDDDYIEIWLDRSLKAFDGSTPRQMIDQERWTELEDMFYRLLTGEPS